MDGYDEEIDRQSGAPFTNKAERKRIRRVAEHWVERRRYKQERDRRLATYLKWIGIASPVTLGIIKIIEAYLAKGP